MIYTSPGFAIIIFNYFILQISGNLITYSILNPCKINKEKANLPEMEESSFLVQWFHFDPCVIPGIIPIHCINSSLAFCVVITLTSDNKQEVTNNSNPVLISEIHNIHITRSWFILITNRLWWENIYARNNYQDCSVCLILNRHSCAFAYIALFPRNVKD